MEKLNQEKIKFAKKLLEANIDIAEISKMTDLKVEQIRKIDN